MADAISDLTIISGASSHFQKSDDTAFVLGKCPNCGGTQLIVLGFKTNESPTTRWLRCANCKHGLVQNGETTSPSTLPLRVPKGVVGAELAVWEEVRACLGAGATTAAVMLCRKLLLHVAISQGLDEEDKNGRSPNFQQAVKHLESEGAISKRMRVWVDRIKDVGNEANHDIKPISIAQALDVAEFTEQLLRLTYELDVLIAERAESELAANAEVDLPADTGPGMPI